MIIVELIFYDFYVIFYDIQIRLIFIFCLIFIWWNQVHICLICVWYMIDDREECFIYFCSPVFKFRRYNWSKVWVWVLVINWCVVYFFFIWLEMWSCVREPIERVQRQRMTLATKVVVICCLPFYINQYMFFCLYAFCIL